LAVIITGERATIRNNIMDMTSAHGKGSVVVRPPFTAPPPADIHVYNNTFYCGSGGDYFVGVTVDPAAVNTKVVNNLGWAPGARGPLLISGTGTGLVASNNSSDAQVEGVSPSFTAATPMAPADFAPTVGSYAIGAATAVPVWSDFFRAPRSASGDLGAVLH
jgi:hypothetical protein